MAVQSAILPPEATFSKWKFAVAWGGGGTPDREPTSRRLCSREPLEASEKKERTT